MGQTITAERIEAFGRYLIQEERSEATIEKYLREMGRFAAFLAEKPVTKEAAAAWKAELIAQGYHPAIINAKLSALDRMLAFLGEEECRVRHMKLQRRVFREDRQELTREEYLRLIAAARDLGRERLGLLMETICATGIRVSEVRYITREAVEQGKAEVNLKGKVRTILIPGKLCWKLRKYAQKQKIASGELFVTRSGRSLSRKQIWAEMKAVCERANVESTKVFPHNLRHLFARCFYQNCRDVVRLADVMGHSSMETTRIYLISTGAEHAKVLEELRLVL